jgi:hypothetical protein
MRLSRKHTAAGEPLPTENREWGFFGTLIKGGIVEEIAEHAFATAGRQLIQAGFSPEDARRALDSTRGRHLADWLVDQIQEAIGSAIMGALDGSWEKFFPKEAK